MSDLAGLGWNADPDRDVDRGRRRLLLAAAALAASAPLAGIPASAIASDPIGFVHALGNRYRARAVELTALRYAETDRSLALRLLWAAFVHDLAPGAGRTKSPLRLYDLYAALGTTIDRLALAGLVRGASADPALLARAILWADAARPARQRIWRTIDAAGAPLGIFIAPA